VRTPDLWFDPCAFVLQQPDFSAMPLATPSPDPVCKRGHLAEQNVSHPRAAVDRVSRRCFQSAESPESGDPGSPTGSAVTGGVIVFPAASSAGAPTGGQIFRTSPIRRQMQISLRYQF